MNDGLKQRVVGALVLVVLAVIFLPMVFDFRGERTIDRTSQIPERPQITPVVVPEATRPEGVVYPKPTDKVYQLDKPRADAERAAAAEPAEESAQQDSQQSAQQAKQKNKPTVEKPALADNGLPVGWVVQVGSFKEQGKASKLEAQLIDDGYKAYTRHSRSQGFYRVYVGPSVDKSQALTIKKAIDSKYRVSAMLLKFEP